MSWKLLCRPGWPWTHRDPPVSASQVLRLQVCTTTIQCDHRNSYKGKHSIRVAYLQFRDSIHYDHGGTWRKIGRHGSESPTSFRQQKVVCGTGQYLEHMRPQSPSPQWHTSSKRPHLLKQGLLIVILLLRTIFFQSTMKQRERERENIILSELSQTQKDWQIWYVPTYM